MFGETRRALGILAGATGVTLALGVGVSTGLVPKASDAPATASESAGPAPVVQAVVPEVLAAAVPETTVPTVPPTTAPPTTVARRVAPPTTRPAAKAAVAAAPAAAEAPAQPTLAPRTVPSPAQVQQVISGISSMVRLPLFARITPAHVADIGNQICTAFDQGQTFAQVKATGLAMVTRYGVTVSDAAADYAVRQGVALYCPAYASKLG